MTLIDYTESRERIPDMCMYSDLRVIDALMFVLASPHSAVYGMEVKVVRVTAGAIVDMLQLSTKTMASFS